MLRSVELALRSVPTSTAENSAIQDVLHDIDDLHKQAFMELSELDSLTEKLQSTTPTPTATATATYPKVAKWSWLRQSKNLEKLQSQMSGTTQALYGTMMALNTIQLGSLQSYAISSFVRPRF